MEDNSNFTYFYLCHSIYTDISHLLLKYLLYIENALRTNVSYVIARDFSTIESQYLDVKNYLSKVKLKTKNRYEIIKELSKTLNDPHKNSHTYYFKVKKNAEVPPWILLMDVDFHLVISIYANLKDQLRKEIRDFFWANINISENNANSVFFNSMNFIREYRNIFAHGKRNFKEKINFSVSTDLLKSFYDPEYLNIEEFKNSSSNSLYSCILLIYAYLVDVNMKSRFYTELYFLFHDYVEDNGNGKTVFNDKTIFDILGLPSNFYIVMKFNETFN